MYESFKVTAWCNGGSGYGLKVTQHDRDLYFSKDIKTIDLSLPNRNKNISININKPSFWKNCRELIHCGIKEWLDENGYIPWSKGSPPKFNMIKISEKSFKLVIPKIKKEQPIVINSKKNNNPSWDKKLENFIKEMSYESNFKDFGFENKPCCDYLDEGKFLSFDGKEIELKRLMNVIREKSNVDINILDIDIKKFIRKLIWLTYKIKNICGEVPKDCDYKNIKEYISNTFKDKCISKKLYDKYSVLQDCKIIIEEIDKSTDFKGFITNHFLNIKNKRKNTIKYDIQPCFNINLDNDLEIFKIGDACFIKKSSLTSNKKISKILLGILPSEQDKQYINNLASDTIVIIKYNCLEDADFKLKVIQSLIHVYLKISNNITYDSLNDLCLNFGSIEQSNLYEIPLYYQNTFFDMRLVRLNLNTRLNDSRKTTGSRIYINKERYKNLLDEKIVSKSKIIFSKNDRISRLLYWFSKARQANIKSEKLLNFCIALEIFSENKNNNIEKILKDLSGKDKDFRSDKDKIKTFHKDYPSLTQQIIEKIEELEIAFNSAKFKDIYDIRSKIVHEGRHIIEEDHIKYLHELVLDVSYKVIENILETV